jgi:hypothetical protein
MHAEWMGPVFAGNVHDAASVEPISAAATLAVSFDDIGCDDFFAYSFAFPVECLRDFPGNAAHGTGHDTTTHFFRITAHDKNTARTDLQVSAENCQCERRLLQSQAALASPVKPLANVPSRARTAGTTPSLDGEKHEPCPEMKPVARDRMQVAKQTLLRRDTAKSKQGRLWNGYVVLDSRFFG